MASDNLIDEGLDLLHQDIAPELNQNRHEQGAPNPLVAFKGGKAALAALISDQKLLITQQAGDHRQQALIHRR